MAPSRVSVWAEGVDGASSPWGAVWPGGWPGLSARADRVRVRLHSRLVGVDVVPVVDSAYHLCDRRRDRVGGHRDRIRGRMTACVGLLARAGSYVQVWMAAGDVKVVVQVVPP